MELYKLSGCCGIREINGLSSHCVTTSIGEPPKELNVMSAFKAFASKVSRRRIWTFEGKEVKRATDDFKWRFCLFTQNKNNTYGDQFAAFIRDNQLGQVLETDTQVNPNSGNPLKLFIWTVDWPRLNAYINETLGEPTIVDLKKEYVAYYQSRGVGQPSIDAGLITLAASPYRRAEAVQRLEEVFNG
jgi:hypothetical protein